MPRPWERRRVVYRRPVGSVPTRPEDAAAPGAYSPRSDDDVRRQIEADREASERSRREAYERGVREGRHSKKGHPILTLVVIALAALGLVFLGLWIRSGSPSQAGAQIGTAAVVAGDRAGEAARTAGDVVQEEVQERTDGNPATPPPGEIGAREPAAAPSDAAATSTETTRTTTSTQRQ